MSNASEDIVGLFHKGEDDIARRLVWVLVGFTLQDNTLALHGASGNVNFENLLLLCCSLALALLASVLLLEDLTGTLAVIANNGLTAHHTRTDLTEGLNDTIALAALAGRRLGLLFAARALALAAKYLLVRSKLDSLATVKLLERHLVLLFLIGTTSGSASAAGASRASRASGTHAEAKHLGEDVVEVDLRTTRTASGLVEGGHAVNIVELALLLIAENFVGLRDFLELGFGFFSMLFGDLVWVILEGGLAVSLLDLIWCGSSVDLQKFIEIDLLGTGSARVERVLIHLENRR